MKKIIFTLIASLLMPLTALGAPAFTVSQGGTGTGTPWSKYPLTGNGSSALVASSTLWLPGINATGTSDALASTFVRARLTFSTTTNATTTNLFSTTASTTNLFGSNLTACSGSSFLQWTGGLFGCASPAAVTGWSTTSQDYWNSQFRDWSVQGTGYLAPTTTRGILISALASASSTIPNLSVTNGTTTNATSTNFFSTNSIITNATSTNHFSTTASSTNLFSQNLQANIKTYPSFTYATTTWTGTTTIPLGPAIVGEIWNSVACFTDAGTLNLDFYYNSTHIQTPSTTLNGSTTVNINVFSTNTQIPTLAKRYVDIGTAASSPAKISCTISRTYLSN